MNPMLSIRHWSHEHMHWPHISDVKLTSDKLIHSPIFWLMVALLVFIAVMVILSLFAGGGSPQQLPTPYYPYGGGWPAYP